MFLTHLSLSHVFLICFSCVSHSIGCSHTFLVRFSYVSHMFLICFSYFVSCFSYIFHMRPIHFSYISRLLSCLSYMHHTLCVSHSSVSHMFVVCFSYGSHEFLICSREFLMPGSHLFLVWFSYFLFCVLLMCQVAGLTRPWSLLHTLAASLHFNTGSKVRNGYPHDVLSQCVTAWAYTLGM